MSMNIETSLQAWKVAAGALAETSLAADAPRITLKDGGAAANRAQRRELLEVLSQLPCVSEDYYDRLVGELGLSGDGERATRPLEARQVRQLIEETEMHAACEQTKAVTAGAAVMSKHLDEIFTKGVGAVLQEVYIELAKIVSAEGTSEARRMALAVLREELLAHAKETADLAMAQAPNLCQTGAIKSEEDAKRGIEEYRSYAKLLTETYRRAAENPEAPIGPDPEILAEGLKTFVVLKGLVTVAEVAMRLRTVAVKLTAQLRLAARESLLAAAKERLNRVKAELQLLIKAFTELLQEQTKNAEAAEKVQKLIDEAMDEAVLKCRDEKDEEISAIIAGFEDRLRRQQSEVREAVTGHKVE